MKDREQEEKAKEVPSGPLTLETPESPFEVRPPWLRRRRAYLTWGRIWMGFSKRSSAMSPTQSTEE